VLTLIAAVIAAVPGLLALNKEHAAIYYSVEASGIQIPDSLDPSNVRKVLSSNGIPSNTVNVELEAVYPKPKLNLHYRISCGTCG
jgi:hypothetical protein